MCLANQKRSWEKALQPADSEVNLKARSKLFCFGGLGVGSAKVDTCARTLATTPQVPVYSSSQRRVVHLQLVV